MPRPSNREQRRAELVCAFAMVLADHGFAGATMVAVAARAGVSPGLLHYHFRDKRDMLDALVDSLTASFLTRTRERAPDLDGWVDSALSTEQAEQIEARCWVGVLGEALRDPVLFERIRRLLGAELRTLQRRSGDSLSQSEAAALMSLTVGYLIVGAFRPDRTGGEASHQASRFLALLTRE